VEPSKYSGPLPRSTFTSSRWTPASSFTERLPTSMPIGPQRCRENLALVAQGR
jgi:hypothetical protein